MGQFKGQGIVLRSLNLGEWDKLLTVFAEGQGKIKVVAKGARKIQSRYASLTQPFCQIQFTVYSGKNMHTFSQVELVESYRPLREDLSRMTYGLYMLELVDITLEENQAHDDILSLLIACLHILAHTDHLELLLAFFELRLLSRLGWRLNLDACPVCGMEAGTKLSIANVGLICPGCVRAAGSDLVTVSEGALKLLRLLCGGDYRRIESLTRPINNEREVAQVLDRIVLGKLDKKPGSLDFLTQIRNVR